MIAGTEGFRLTVPDQRELAAQHHEPDIEVMRVQIAYVRGLMPAMHHLEAFPAQIAFERFTRDCLAVSAPTRDIGDALPAD